MKRRWWVAAVVGVVGLFVVWWVAMPPSEETRPTPPVTESGWTPPAPAAGPVSSRRRVRLERPSSRPDVEVVADSQLAPRESPDDQNNADEMGDEQVLSTLRDHVTRLLSEQCVGPAWADAVGASESGDFLVAGATQVQVELDERGLADVFLVDNGGSSDVLLSCYADQVWGQQWPAMDDAVVLSLDVRMLIEVNMDAGTLSFPSTLDGEDGP